MQTPAVAALRVGNLLETGCSSLAVWHLGWPFLCQTIVTSVRMFALALTKIPELLPCLLYENYREALVQPPTCICISGC